MYQQEKNRAELIWNLSVHFLIFGLVHSGEEGQLVSGAGRPRDDDNCEADDSHNQAKNHQKNSLETQKPPSQQKSNLSVFVMN